MDKSPESANQNDQKWPDSSMEFLNSLDLSDFEEETDLHPMFEGLSPIQISTIHALLTTRSTSEASQVSGVPIRTINRWRNQEAFKQALGYASSEHLKNLTTRLNYASESALDTLLSIVEDPSVASGVRARSAIALIEMRLKTDELYSIRLKLDTLEQLSQYDQ
jgi:hypothetical protein